MTSVSPVYHTDINQRVHVARKKEGSHVLGVTTFEFFGMPFTELLVLLSSLSTTSSQSVDSCVSIWCAVDNAILLVRYTEAGKLSCH
jgi:hypothetical protein